MKCTGCGQPLEAGSKRGRPARYHNAACRQRARRARVATRHGDVLAAVAAVEAAAAEVRHAVLTDGNADQITHQLTRATAEVARLVTPAPAAEAAEPLAPAVTKPVTEAKPRTSRSPRSTRSAPLDLDTVRLERSSDSTRTGWRVLAGATDAPVVVGFLEPVLSVTGRRSSRWEAQTASMARVHGGPWRNQMDALARLVDDYQRAASRPRRHTIT
ncbi:hypothetical protein SAMN05660733_05401 [Lentzea albidocapillata]|uniref:Uncharacterized protein n=1 Tax=Lentzea albidocapillata TaxID=40571 RepID=A0A1W2FB09_9PSEU|nr:hypothetical protein SAMN05660733_05401 [Lentzea albidocapillata]